MAAVVVAASSGECEDRSAVGGALLDIDIRDVTVSWFCLERKQKQKKGPACIKNTLRQHNDVVVVVVVVVASSKWHEQKVSLLASSCCCCCR